MGVHNKITNNTSRKFVIKYRDVRSGELLVIARLMDTLEACRS